MFGILLAVIGTGAWYASITTDAVVAREVEDEMYDANLHSGILSASEHKRSRPLGMSDESAPADQANDASELPESK